MLGPAYPEGADVPKDRYSTGYNVMGNIIKPPYTTLTAYDLNKGTIRWQMPVGDDPRALAGAMPIRERRAARRHHYNGDGADFPGGRRPKDPRVRRRNRQGVVDRKIAGPGTRDSGDVRSKWPAVPGGECDVGVGWRRPSGPGGSGRSVDGLRHVRAPCKIGSVDTLFELNAPLAPERELLRQRLRALAARGVYMGGSSWKYEGWLGQIYTPSRYQTRGRFSKKLFEETCLGEYAEVFPTVCGDFAFYQFPSEAFWAKLFRQTPPTFRWGFKVPEHITVPVWPVHPRYGALAGLENPTYLDAGLLREAFLRVLEPYRLQTGVLIFEFGRTSLRGAEFVAKLDAFLGLLPEGFRYAVEIRNAEFLGPGYFDCLRAHNVPHVFNSWTRMPGIQEQIAMPGSVTADMIVARGLLKQGRAYEDAVRMFSPYNRVQEVNAPVRAGLRELVDMALVDGTPAFIFVNNRLEGNSPGTMVAITE